MTKRIDSPVIDGFPFDPPERDHTIHAVIDGMLRNCDAASGTNAAPGLLYPEDFDASAEKRRAWLDPTLRRFAWNAGREPWDKYLRGLLRLLIGWANPPSSLGSVPPTGNPDCEGCAQSVTGGCGFRTGRRA